MFQGVRPLVFITGYEDVGGAGRAKGGRQCYQRARSCRSSRSRAQACALTAERVTESTSISSNAAKVAGAATAASIWLRRLEPKSWYLLLEVKLLLLSKSHTLPFPEPPLEEEWLLLSPTF